MNEKIKEIINKIDGNVIGIGLKKEFVDLINENDNIIKFTLLENNSNDNGEKGGWTKIVHIKKIHKIFKKKRIDYMIVNYKDIKRFTKYFVKNGIYITKNKIFIYGNLTQDNLEEITNKFNRYKVAITVTKEKNKTLMEIDSSNSTNDYFKDKLYLLIDTVSELLTILSDILVK